MSLKAVIFDFNGVIVDDYPLQKEVWSKIALMVRGSAVSDEEMMKEIRGVPTKDTITRMSGGKLEASKVQELAKQKDTLMREAIETSPLFRLNTGLEEFLNDLKKKNIPLTIATSASKEIFSFLAERLQLAQWFNLDILIFSDGTFKGKPAPDHYILAAKKIGLNASECVVFEDAKSGIQSAHDAGCENIVAIGTDDRLEVLTKLPGVVKGIHDFSEITVESLFRVSK